jgi:hypothetical protein
MKLTANFRTDIDHKITGGLDWHGLSDDVQANLMMVVENAQAIRDYLGKPVIVSSGLRSQAKNASLDGASKTSQHLYGEALDLVLGDNLDRVFRGLMMGLIHTPHPFSQVIHETNGSGAQWLHIAVVTDRWVAVNKGKPHRLTQTEFLETKDGKAYKLVSLKPFSVL